MEVLFFRRGKGNRERLRKLFQVPKADIDRLEPRAVELTVRRLITKLQYNCYWWATHWFMSSVANKAKKEIGSGI